MSALDILSNQLRDRLEEVADLRDLRDDLRDERDDLRARIDKALEVLRPVLDEKPANTPLSAKMSMREVRAIALLEGKQ